MKNIQVVDMSDQNFQIYPAKEIILPTDNLSNTIFVILPHQIEEYIKNSVSDEEYETMTEQEIKAKIDECYTSIMKQDSPITFSEKETIKVNGKFKTITESVQFWLHIVEDYTEENAEKASLSDIDRLVLSACMAEQANNNSVTTLDVIHRNLGGGNGFIAPEKLEEYLKSINKLMNIEIVIDAVDASHKLKQFKNGKLTTKLVGRLLSCQFVYTKLNGQLVKVAVQFLAPSPLFTYAALKGQITYIPSSDLFMKSYQNTWAFLQLKSYIYTRIQAIKKTRQYNKKFPAVMRIETIFKNCGKIVKEKDYRLKKRLREQITDYLEFLVTKGVIKKFLWLDEFDKPNKDLKKCTKIVFAYNEKKNGCSSEFSNWYDEWSESDSELLEHSGKLVEHSCEVTFNMPKIF